MWGRSHREGADGPLAGLWVRQPYRVAEGYIKPASLGFSRYDPFDSYYGTDAATAGRSLYLELIDLNASDSVEVEAFTSKWGLLGLYQHRLLQLAHSDWTYPHNFPPAPEAVPEDLVEHFRTPGHPEYGFRSFDPVLTFWKPEDQAERAAIYGKWLRRRPFPSEWVIHETPAGHYDIAPTREFSQRYFPDPPLVAMTEKDFEQAVAAITAAPDVKAKEAAREEMYRMFELPPPGSEAMWERLCEPLADFQTAVAELQQIYQSCQLANEGRSAVRAMADCAMQLRRVSPVPYLTEEGVWSWRWFFPSLLSACYTMLFLDFVVENRKLLHCAECGQSMVSDRSDKRYCGRTCQNRANQRRWRERTAQASDDQGPKEGDNT